jgi:CO/xanthine dehydrogenase Mo-binding subunit
MPDEFQFIGKPGMPRPDGLAKVSGKGAYTIDVKLPGMLYAKEYVSPKVHAKIKSMDISGALALPGVWSVLKYDDPEQLAVPVSASQWFAQEYFLPQEAYYCNQPMGFAVCADSLEICDVAVRMIAKTIEWEDLPYKIQPWEACKVPFTPDTSTIVHTPKAPLEGSDNTVTLSYVRRQWSSNSVEPGAAVVYIDGELLRIWFHGQNPNEVPWFYASRGMWPLDKIQVNSVLQGGTFGGMSYLAWAGLTQYMAFIFAKRTGRPVSARFHESKFHGISDDYGYHEYTIGFDDDGKLNEMVCANVGTSDNGGNWCYECSAMTKPAGGTTEMPPCNDEVPFSIRYGGNGCLAFNMAIEYIAEQVGMDPIECYLLNDGCEGKPMSTEIRDYKVSHNFPDRDSLKECVDKIKAMSNFDAIYHKPGARTLPNGNLHGLGIAQCMIWHPGPWYGPGCTHVGIQIRQDGTVNILGQRGDTGQASAAWHAIVVAEEMGMKIEDVRNDEQTEYYGFKFQSPGGSSGTISALASLVSAARKTKLRLLELACKQANPNPAANGAVFFAGLTPDKLSVRNSEVFETANPTNKFTVKQIVSAGWSMVNDFFISNKPIFDWDCVIQTKTGSAYSAAGEHYYHMGRQVQMMEVEVDPETGNIDVKNVWIVNDAGQAIFLDSYLGQLYGGTYQGAGVGKQEELFHDPVNGVVVNDNMIDYKMASYLDLGVFSCDIINAHLGYTPYGAMGVGEDGGCLSRWLIASAAHNATGKWIGEGPLSPDKVLKSLGKI